MFDMVFFLKAVIVMNFICISPTPIGHSSHSQMLQRILLSLLWMLEDSKKVRRRPHNLDVPSYDELLGEADP